MPKEKEQEPKKVEFDKLVEALLKVPPKPNKKSIGKAKKQNESGR